MATPRQRYSQHKSRATHEGIPFTLTFQQRWDLWNENGLYQFRGRGGYVMAQMSPSDGFVPGNVEIIPARQVFAQTMDAHYCGERDYLI
jgi:hypothetical protein